MLVKEITFEGKTFLDVSVEYLKGQGVPESDIEKAIRSEQWVRVRAKRDQLIAATDWTQMVDSPLSVEKRDEFALYRQALRDLPQAFTDPDAVVWPEEPTL